MLALTCYLGLWILAALVPSAHSSLLPRLHRRDNPYETAVCYPSVAPGSQNAPCVIIAAQQSSCAPNPNTPSGQLAAQSCLCNSQFFADWVGCQDCLLYHGIESDNWYNAWLAEIAVVSQSYCSGTPTAYFDTVFSSMTYNMPYVASEGSTDQAYGETDIGLYYTPPTTNQGSGPTITVTAAMPTSTTPTTSTSYTRTTTGGSGGSGSPKTTQSTSSGAFEFVAPDGKSTLTVYAGVMSTAYPVGWALAAAGGALLVAQ